MPISPAFWVLDSSVLVPYLRSGKYRDFLLTGMERGTIFLPGVVLCELYAGATSRADRTDVEELRKALGSHLLESVTEDWVLAGQCLAYYSRRWGRIKPRNHLVDVLVAVSAVKMGAVLASRDHQQMRRWSWILGRLGRKLQVQRVPE